MIDIPRHIDLDNAEFRQAYDLLQHTDANIFLTGKAGTGKSTFLRYICGHLRKRYVVLAPTGVAAVNVGGVTIHSFFQMPLRPVPPDDPDYSIPVLKKTGRLSRQKRKLMSELELIVIDEVSMVRPDMIDFIDRTLRAVRGRRGEPFGGVQMLLVGDIFQLEPVVTPDARAILKNYYEDFFFFNALAYKSANLVSVELKKIYRQADSEFIGLLDRIRVNSVTAADMRLLNSRVGVADKVSGQTDTSSGSLGITLASRRDVAAMINKEKMDELPDEEMVYEGEIKDDFPEKLLPTDLRLVLKKNAQVMLIRNDKERRWVNGTLARVVDLSDNEVTVELENGMRESVEKETWENISYEYDDKERKVKENVLGTFSQYPLKAAWALTIHKSQGLTFNNVTIDMGGGAFSAGQTYVALSRCRSMEGLSFINPLRRYDVIVSGGALEFSKNYNDSSRMERVLADSKVRKLSEKALIDFSSGDMSEAVDAVWEIHAMSGALDKPVVRRFISKSLGEMKKLRDDLAVKDNKLKMLSKDFLKMGDVCLETLDDPSSAIHNYRKADELSGGLPEAKYKMALCHYRMGKVRKAKKSLDEITAGKSRVRYDALMLKGHINEEEGNHSAAVIDYLAASKDRKNIADPIRRVIEIYDRCGMEEMADRYRGFMNESF